MFNGEIDAGFPFITSQTFFSSASVPGEILPETVSAQAAVCLSQSTGGSGVHPTPLGSFDRMQGFQPGMKSRKIPTKSPIFCLVV